MTISAPSSDFASLAMALRRHGLLERLLVWLLDDPRWFAAGMRAVWPIACIGRRALVTRYDHVMEILGRDRDFPVPFGPKFKQLDKDGENFLLGMERDETYLGLHRYATEIFHRSDLARIATLASDKAEELVEIANGEIDSMAGLLTQVPVHIIDKYFGIRSDDADFALQLMAMNNHSFLHLMTNPAVEPAGLAAAKQIGPLVDEAIQQAKTDPDLETIVGRFVAAQAGEARQRKPEDRVLTDRAIRATIIGFMLGFLPTNNRASGQIMEWLLRHPGRLADAEKAARDGDDDLLGRLLFEALRFHPINPGPFRLCASDTVVAAGTPHEKRICAGTIVLVSTQSASFDSRRVARPNDFDPYRSLTDTMRFGWGQHWCIGAGIAMTQMTQTFKALLRRGNLARAAGKPGKSAHFGVFYEHLFVTYR